MITKKPWGITEALFIGPTSEFHYLQIEKGGYCSQHLHNKKHNRFYVLAGTINVRIFSDSIQENILSTGMSFDVAPGTTHSFEAIEASKVLEIYWTDTLDPTDIIRFTEGGIIS